MALKLTDNKYLKIEKSKCYVQDNDTYLTYSIYKDTETRENEKDNLATYTAFHNKVVNAIATLNKKLKNATIEDEQNKISNQLGNLYTAINYLDATMFSYAMNYQDYDYKVLKPYGFKPEWAKMKLLPIGETTLNVGTLFNSIDGFDYSIAYEKIKEYLNDTEDC